MLQTDGVVLERGVQIRLSQVSRVARFGKKAKVAQFEPFHQLAVFPKKRPGVSLMEEGVGRQKKQKQKVTCQVKQKKIGFSHETNPDFLPRKALHP